MVKDRGARRAAVQQEYKESGTACRLSNKHRRKHSPDQTRCDRDKTWNHRILRRPASLSSALSPGWGEVLFPFPTGSLPRGSGSQLRRGASSLCPTTCPGILAPPPWAWMKGSRWTLLTGPGRRKSLFQSDPEAFSSIDFLANCPQKRAQKGKRSCTSKL